jgi:hypothetical protein
MTGSMKEPPNPLYMLLLVVGLVFVGTALAYAIIPVMEQKATDAGSPPPPSEFRDALRQDGWKWLLVEVGVLVVVGVASMVWDRLRSLQNPSQEATISPPVSDPPSTPTVVHVQAQQTDLAGRPDQ